jgi:hypothetical protein
MDLNLRPCYPSQMHDSDSNLHQLHAATRKCRIGKKSDAFTPHKSQPRVLHWIRNPPTNSRRLQRASNCTPRTQQPGLSTKHNTVCSSCRRPSRQQPQPDESPNMLDPNMVTAACAAECIPRHLLARLMRTPNHAFKTLIPTRWRLHAQLSASPGGSLQDSCEHPYTSSRHCHMFREEDSPIKGRSMGAPHCLSTPVVDTAAGNTRPARLQLFCPAWLSCASHCCCSPACCRYCCCCCAGSHVCRED